MEKIVYSVLKDIVDRKYHPNISNGAQLVEDLGLDSMGLIRLVVALEDETNFDLEDTDVDLTTIVSVGDIVSLLDALS